MSQMNFPSRFDLSLTSGGPRDPGEFLEPWQPRLSLPGQGSVSVRPGLPRRRPRRSRLLLGLIVAAALCVPLPACAAGRTARISVASGGAEGNSNSADPTISADGRYVAFISQAGNLLPGGAGGGFGGLWQVFVHDRISGKNVRVSTARDGAPGNNDSFRPVISADGRFVAFLSYADNLVRGDTNRRADIFVHDLVKGSTTRVSVTSHGAQAYRDSDFPGISADGRFVTFSSYASNLVPGDTNGNADIFVHDRRNHSTTRVNLAQDGSQANSDCEFPALSADGRFVAFISFASNLVPRDTNGNSDVFVHDRKSGITTRVSLASNGTQGNLHSVLPPAISADGRFVAFQSEADNLVPGDTNLLQDIFVHDRKNGQTTRVSIASDGTQTNRASYWPAISADGRFVTYWTEADNLVRRDTNGLDDVFMHDRKSGKSSRVSLASNGREGNSASYYATLSAEGRSVAFYSGASNLVTGDQNEAFDVFVRDRLRQPEKSADVRVTQNASSDPDGKGVSLTYTVLVTNHGPDPASEVNLTDLVPQNASLLSVTPSQGSCYRGPITVCRLGELAAGANAKVFLNLRAKRTAVLKNTASVNAAPRDPAPHNNAVTRSARAE